MAGQIASASAPGKVILFGEHAVVYGYPAIAVPLLQLEARAEASDFIGPAPAGFIQIDAPDISLHSNLQSLPLDDPISLAVRGVLTWLDILQPPPLQLKINSTIPVAAGFGSGAAVSVAIIRALAQYFGKSIPADIVSSLAYEVEKKHHGRPSGIDNTVITYAQPIFFQREKPFEILPPFQPFSLVIADSGVPSPTALAVAGVRERCDLNPARFQAMFAEIGGLVTRAREKLISGPVSQAGPLMLQNHELLREIGVSIPVLDRLVEAAVQAGALGAKLSGGGLGGNIIALAENPDSIEKISRALLKNGAASCFSTSITGQRR